MADDPYAAELDAFVAQRKALVGELRSAGDRDGAKAAGALRKPSVAAWAVNQLVHRHGDLVAAFRAAADQARGAQVDLAGGGDRDAWRAAMAAVRGAQGALMDAVAEMGVSPAARDGAEATLAAAAADESVEAEALSGRLVREVEPGGSAGCWRLTFRCAQNPTNPTNPTSPRRTTRQRVPPPRPSGSTPSDSRRHARGWLTPRRCWRRPSAGATTPRWPCRTRDGRWPSSRRPARRGAAVRGRRRGRPGPWR